MDAAGECTVQWQCCGVSGVPGHYLRRLRSHPWSRHCWRDNTGVEQVGLIFITDYYITTESQLECYADFLSMYYVDNYSFGFICEVCVNLPKRIVSLL